ncbi:unnamed protein product [Lampetra planeri]
MKSGGPRRPSAEPQPREARKASLPSSQRRRLLLSPSPFFSSSSSPPAQSPAPRQRQRAEPGGGEAT